MTSNSITIFNNGDMCFYEDLHVIVRMFNALVVNKVSNSDWVIDLGCTHHMTPNKNWFVNLKNIKECFVLMGLNCKCLIKDVSLVKIKQFNGNIRLLDWGCSYGGFSLIL